MADASDDEDAPSALALLPRAIVLLAFAPLPVDLRCACVCRGWHAALSERSFWTRLDVSRTSGVTGAVTDAFLRGAAARAGGALQTLDVSGSNALSLEALLEVATANAATLRQLRVCHSCNMYEEHFLPFRHAKELLRAAPQLRVFDVDVGCDGVAHARQTLCIRRKKGLLAPLRIRGLCFNTHRADEAALLALAADVASHAWLRTLCVSGPLRTPAALDAVVDAALTRRLAAVHFVDCDLVPASAPALARLLGGSSLEELLVLGNRYAAALLDAPALPRCWRARCAQTRRSRGCTLRASTCGTTLQQQARCWARSRRTRACARCASPTTAAARRKKQSAWPLAPRLARCSPPTRRR
jgi:hypothetical protein